MYLSVACLDGALQGRLAGRFSAAAAGKRLPPMNLLDRIQGVTRRAPEIVG
jgi:hypothetical protein